VVPTLNKKGLIAALIPVFSILLIDQIVKIYIKTHYFYGESVFVAGNWFILHFIENNGMSFGMEFAGSYGKLFLTLFRIVAAGAIAWYLHSLVKKRANIYLIITFSLVLAGAIGNIIDCMFYGMIFNESLPYPSAPAVMFPPEGGYAAFMHGKVVDMLYFPIIETTWPSWIPFVGGEEFTFSPVFNIADSAITVGVLVLLLFQKWLFRKPVETDSTETPLAPETPELPPL
jgi:signal peptidase II